jgi:hypothetical protein
MKKCLITSIIICTACIFARGQTDSAKIQKLNNEILKLNSQYKNMQGTIDQLNKSNGTMARTIDSLRLQLISNNNAIVQTGASLNSRIQETGTKSEQKITQTSDLLSRKALYWIIVFLALTAILALLFILLSRKQKSDKSQLLEQLSHAKSSIETNLVNEFSKQTKLMETQLGIMENQAKTNTSAGNAEIDHSLALKLADEINLIERNINLMDAKTKGIKQLTASVGKLKDNLAANNYEIPELLGKPFHQGMKVIVTNSVPDESLTKGEEVITRIIKPQVNYNDKMIQAAQIEVSVGY